MKIDGWGVMRVNQRGQGLIEFALVLPILLALVLGIINFAYVFAAHASLVNAAREAVRYGMVDPTNAQGICDRVVETAFLTHPDISTITVLYDNSDGLVDIIEVTCDEENLEDAITAGELKWEGENPGRDRVSVRIQHELPAITPLIRASFDIDVVARRTITRIRG